MRLLKRAEEAGWTALVGREALVDVAQRARTAPEYATKSSVSLTARNAAPRDAAHQAPFRTARTRKRVAEAARNAAPRDAAHQAPSRTARLLKRAEEGARTARVGREARADWAQTAEA